MTAFGLGAVLTLGACGNVPTDGTRAGAGPAVSGAVRVNQAGYAGTAAKEAFLLAKGQVRRAAWKLVDTKGRTAASGRTGTSLGRWNDAYPAVYAIDFTSVKRSGTYRLKVGGTASVSSPEFVIGSAARVNGRLADQTLAFFQSQRDGRRVVPGTLLRKPSHLNDRRAAVYDWPEFTNEDGDAVKAPPKPLGVTRDVEGGWFDAGDYVKFTQTTSYAVAAMQIAARDSRAPHHSPLGREARHGLDWLDKMWDERTRTLYIQVGLGTGTEDGSVAGDHDVWRLPEADDKDDAPAHRFLKNRPVFRAGPPGSRISPNQAGRLTADFALAAQRHAKSDRRLAKRYLAKAAQIYALADTRPGRLVTVLPHSYYPETSWKDDLAFGGAELALAAQSLKDRRAGTWLAASTKWIKDYAKDAGHGTLNVYDTSALAYADLARAVRAAGKQRPARPPVGYRDLVAALKAQITTGKARADRDPFHAGAAYDDWDANSHTLGLAASARMYATLTGDRSLDRFASQQLGWVLGANAWGTSFMVGAGTTFPKCTAGQLNNLAGSTDGRPPVQVGAIINGPNSADLFEDDLGDDFWDMRPCPADGKDPYKEFTGRGSRYLDDVRAWMSSEAALDFDASGLLAFTLSR